MSKRTKCKPRSESPWSSPTCTRMPNFSFTTILYSVSISTTTDDSGKLFCDSNLPYRSNTYIPFDSFMKLSPLFKEGLIHICNYLKECHELNIIIPIQPSPGMKKMEWLGFLGYLGSWVNSRSTLHKESPMLASNLTIRKLYLKDQMFSDWLVWKN